MFVFPTGPANDATIVIRGVWASTIDYAEDTTVLYTASNHDIVARNRFVWNVSRAANPDAKLKQVGLDATSVMLGLKLKADIPDTPGYGYCQADARAVIPGEVMNHLAHCEAWGQGQNPAPEIPGGGRPDYNGGPGRRVGGQPRFLPIIDGCVTIDVTRGIYSRGGIEFVAYLEGYV